MLLGICYHHGSFEKMNDRIPWLYWKMMHQHGLQFLKCMTGQYKEPKIMKYFQVNFQNERIREEA